MEEFLKSLRKDGNAAERRIGDEGNWGNVSLVLLLDLWHNLSNKVCMEGEQKDERLVQLKGVDVLVNYS